MENQNQIRMISQDQTINTNNAANNMASMIQSHLGQLGQQQHNNQQQQQQQEEKQPAMTELSQLLKHCKNLEMQTSQLQQQLDEQINKNKKISEKTRQNMQNILDTIMTKWVDATTANDENVKKTFLEGMQRMVQNSAEDNGVWQMMVQASSLYERQTHELDQLKIENSHLKEAMNGTFGREDARISVGDKRKADGELERPPAVSGDPWAEFASIISSNGLRDGF